MPIKHITTHTTNRRAPYMRGFTMVETIMYSFGVMVLIAAIAGLMFYMYNWYQFATISSKVDQLGLTLVDRMVRDIRSGTSIDLSQSIFESATGAIYIHARENGVDSTKRFSLSNGRISYEYNDGSIQYLSPEHMSVSKLLFKNITTSVSQAVRIELEITYTSRSGPITHSFDGLAIMRQSYE